MVHRVSIIIIGRNEERGIARCIEAAIAAAGEIGGAEVIFVDSYSTDRTVSIVEGYGVKTLKLGRRLRRTPSAGRFWGSKHASGEFVLFLDADTIIDPGFLAKAIKYFDNDKKLAGVNGHIRDLNETGEPVAGIEVRVKQITSVKWLRGPSCFYRREALTQAGTFDPDLATEEEAELGLRLLSSGWKLAVIPDEMACHTRCYHPDSISSMLATFRRDIASRRLGEVTRTAYYAFRAGNGMAFCWLRLKTTIVFLFWVLALVFAATVPPSPFPLVLAATVVVLGAMAILIKKRSLYQAVLFFPAKLLNIVDLLAGVNKMRTFSRRKNWPAKPLAHS